MKEEIVSYLHASTSRAKRHYFRVADLDPQNVILAATIYSFYLHVLCSTSLTIIVKSEHLNIARTSATSSLHITMIVQSALPNVNMPRSARVVYTLKKGRQRGNLLFLFISFLNYFIFWR